jgi:ubiquinone/menaquinone biosynthesis C-methylase UbiE
MKTMESQMRGGLFRLGRVEEIHAANIAVHRFEAERYELLHPEVYNQREQERIVSFLKMADRLVLGKTKKALDVGAGTGNVTGKLLRMGYLVTAVDLSSEMCAILKRKYSEYISAGKLVVVNSPVEEIKIRNCFDLITCYSVLHHLPDYETALIQLAGLLKEGGVLYVDHEASPFYWMDEPRALAQLVKLLYFHSVPPLNMLYLRFAGVEAPRIDYTVSDYWHKKEHPVDHARIEKIFREEKFEYFKRIDYYLNGTLLINPLFNVYRRLCRPEMSCWLDRK